ncbi:MAG: DUF2254 domain-containing protein [Thiolinea sp.]
MIKTRILHLIELISNKFWIVPLLCLTAAGISAYLNVFLDKYYFSANATPFSFLLYFNDPQNISTLLTTVAGAILGVAGVAFSVTITSLVLASQQFGPRLLRNFMQDTFNQIVIGLFISTFLYCMLILQFTSNMEAGGFTPVISMLTVLALTITDLLLLVFYIHHIAASIQADSVISAVYEELTERLETQFPEQEEEDEHLPEAETSGFQTDFDQQSRKISTPQSGYLQAVDNEGLLALTKDLDLALQVHFQAGDYIMRGCVLASCMVPDEETAEDLADKVLGYFIIGDVRTPEQDARYAIYQLVEVALRALSPGINDPFTAMSCINRLGSAMAMIMERQLPLSHYYDKQGRLRLQLKTYSFAALLATSFDQIRQNTAHHTGVILSLLETLRQLAAQTRKAEQAAAIQAQADAIRLAAQDTIQVQKDIDAVSDAYQQINRTLQHFKS